MVRDAEEEMRASDRSARERKQSPGQQHFFRLVFRSLILLVIPVAIFCIARVGQRSSTTQNTVPAALSDADAVSIRPASGYLGPGACAECHRDRVREFEETNHFRTCRFPVDGEMPDQFGGGRNTYTPGFPGVRFEMERDGDRFLQTTVRTIDQVEHRTSTQIDLVLGAGTADDVYLAWHEDGRMQELPIAFLWSKDAWGASHFCHPYAEGDFSRPATVRCLECHTTWMDYSPGSTNRYTREGAVLGVTCERCHGPGSDHVAFHSTHPTETEPVGIVNPADLERERLIEVCTQCHSNSITHRTEPFTYRPGEALDEYFRTLSVAASEDEHVANQIDRLRESRCFQESGTMTCITCHDPHRQTPPDHSPADSCLQCHSVAHCDERPRLPDDLRDDCIECHMPKRIKINVKFETEDDNFVPPIRRYQHRIAVYPGARDEVRLAWLKTRADEKSRKEAARLIRQRVADWLAEAEKLRGESRFLAAIGAVREALALEDSSSTRQILKELIDVQSRLYEDWSRALHLISENRLQEAGELLEQVLELQPEHADAHSKLGTVYALLGEERRARAHLLKVSEIDSDNASGHGVLGRMAYRDGRWKEALEHWRRAEQIEPFHAQIQFDIGLTLLKLGKLSRAIEALQKAQRIDPTRLDILSGLCNAFAAAGRRDEAISAITHAQAHVSDRNALREIHRRISMQPLPPAE